MPAPLPEISENVSGLHGVLQYVNDVTTLGPVGLFGISILVMVGLISFLATKSFSFDRAFVYSTFFSLIVGIFLRFLELIPDGVLAFVLVLFIIAVIILFRERDAEGL